jgi:hypothetical protein
MLTKIAGADIAVSWKPVCEMGGRLHQKTLVVAAVAFLLCASGPVEGELTMSMNS